MGLRLVGPPVVVGRLHPVSLVEQHRRLDLAQVTLLLHCAPVPHLNNPTEPTVRPPTRAPRVRVACALRSSWVPDSVPSVVLPPVSKTNHLDSEPKGHPMSQLREGGLDLFGVGIDVLHCSCNAT